MEREEGPAGVVKDFIPEVSHAPEEGEEGHNLVVMVFYDSTALTGQ